MHEINVRDATSYPQVNPNEKRITDFMKVKEELSGQPHELLYCCNCFSCGPWELRCSEERSRMVSVYQQGLAWVQRGIWEATAIGSE